jgi:AcrR family transcriptional regulator
MVKSLDMATSEPTRLSRVERRRAIEDAATALFARQGYEATTVEDIVRAAGLTKPMLYRHFESKQELCISLLRRHREELVAAPLSHFAGKPEQDRQAELVAMIRAWLDHAREHADATRLLFTPMTGDPDVAKVQRELHAMQRATQIALLREFAGVFPEAEAEPMGEVARASLAAIALWWLDHPDVPREALERVLVRMVNGLIPSGDAVYEG